MNGLALLSTLAVAGTPDGGTDFAARMEAMERRLTALEAENVELKEAAATPPPKPPDVSSFSVADGVKIRIGSYADIGFFKTLGDGVAYVRDVGHAAHPELSRFPWVFLGDPWANAVNSQGDSADLGLDRTNIPRFDPIRSGGAATFLVNMVNLTLAASLGDKLFVETSINFEPRQGTLGSPGDFLWIDLAYVEWIPSPDLDLHVFAGLFESTFGIEYRRRKAPDRFGITPSIISRYTTGNPLGVKVRGSFFSGALTYNFAVTNGGMMTERFGHFHNELDRNDFKTLSGRVSFTRTYQGEVPVSFDVGFSGVFGAQDLQLNDGVNQWQFGADLRLDVADFSLRAEWLRSVAQGSGASGAPTLNATGMYGELAWQAFSWAGIGVRVDWRSAMLWAQPNFYLSNVMRFTGSLRFDLWWNVILKIEYLHIRELNPPELPDDVFTTSLVFRY